MLRGQEFAPRVRASSCSAWPCLWLAFAIAGACRSPNTVVEPGAILLHVKCAPATPALDELRVWVWDGSGAIWDNVRIPETGSLQSASGEDLGTILIHPESVQGTLNVHVRGFTQGLRVVDGTVATGSLSNNSQNVAVELSTDAIDDCPFVPRADQKSCSEVPSDAATARFDVGTGPDVLASDTGIRADANTVTGGRPGTGGITGAGGSVGAGGTVGAGGSAGAGGASIVHATGGATGAAGSISVGSGGRPRTGGVASSGGRTPSAGGAGGAPIDAGSGGLGGTTVSGGSSGSGGVTTPVTPPPPVTLPSPACTVEVDDGACSAAGSYCYRYCGPEHQGYKMVSCVTGKYVESDCFFVGGGPYTCYALTSVASCGSTPTAGTACTIPDCQPCGKSSGTSYFDSNKVPKTGYCVCSDGTWSCASTGAWPCPGRAGCQ